VPVWETCAGVAGAEREAGGSGAGSSGSPGTLPRVRLGNGPQVLDLVRLAASPAEEVVPELEGLSFALCFLTEFCGESGFFLAGAWGKPAVGQSIS